ncbi:MAG: 4Fe-4S dicluster domain-containing protein [Chloroflexota bacterium]
MQTPLPDTVIPLPKSDFLEYVNRRSGQKVMRCYQCGKCTAGCPAAYVMDLSPRQVMRAIQLGQRDAVLRSSTIWVCLFCQTCSARCPLEIDIARVMETLRLLAVAEGIKPAQKDVEIFHRLFLEVIRRTGRVYEAGLAGAYNLVSGHLFANVDLLPGMLSKGKLSIIPSLAKGRKELQDIFARVKALEARKN